MKKMKNNIVILAGVVTLLTLTACKRNPEELDRTFEYNPTIDVQTQPSVEPSVEPASTTEPSTEIPETDTHNLPVTPTEPVTTQMSAETVFSNTKSTFSTLPLFNKGSFVEYFTNDYVEGVRFIGTTISDYETYLGLIVADNIYTLNSRETNRAYFQDSKDMCVTVIFKEGVTLIEAGKNYWDLYTYVDKREEATKPAETKDGRYAFFDNQSNAFSKLPYFTEGTLTDYVFTSEANKMIFSNVTAQNYKDYLDQLAYIGYMLAGSFDSVEIYTNDVVALTLTFTDGTLVMEAIFI